MSLDPMEKKYMEKDEIDWTENCLTQGVHNGRYGSIWSIPLGYAVVIFTAENLKALVIERIYSDAMKYVEHSPFVQKGTDETYTFTKEWADLVKKHAEERYDTTLKNKIREMTQYYQSPGWQLEQQESVRRVKENSLNVFYEPLHGHDTINLLCRIVGVGAEHKAATEVLSR